MNDNKNELRINEMTGDQIITYLTIERNWLVLPSNTRQNFEEMLNVQFSDNTWKEFVKYIFDSWSHYGDEGFLDNDFMVEIIEELELPNNKE